MRTIRHIEKTTGSILFAIGFLGVLIFGSALDCDAWELALKFVIGGEAFMAIGALLYKAGGRKYGRRNRY